MDLDDFVASLLRFDDDEAADAPVRDTVTADTDPPGGDCCDGAPRKGPGPLRVGGAPVMELGNLDDPLLQPLPGGLGLVDTVDDYGADAVSDGETQDDEEKEEDEDDGVFHELPHAGTDAHTQPAPFAAFSPTVTPGQLINPPRTRMRDASTPQDADAGAAAPPSPSAALARGALMHDDRDPFLGPVWDQDDPPTDGAEDEIALKEPVVEDGGGADGSPSAAEEALEERARGMFHQLRAPCLALLDAQQQHQRLVQLGVSPAHQKEQVAETYVSELSKLLQLVDAFGSEEPEALRGSCAFVMMPLSFLVSFSHTPAASAAGASTPYMPSCVVSLALQCINAVCRHCPRSFVDNPDMFFATFKGALERIQQAASADEDERIHATMCVAVLFRALEFTATDFKGGLSMGLMHILDTLYSQAYTVAIGFLSSLLLDIFGKEKNRELRVAGLHALSAVMRALPPRYKVGSPVHLFLPGILSAVFKVVTSDFKQGSAVVLAALDAWDDAVCGMLGDDALANVDKDEFVIASPYASRSKQPFDLANLHATLLQAASSASVSTPPDGDDSNGSDDQGDERADADDGAPDRKAVKLSRRWLRSTAERVGVLIFRVYGGGASIVGRLSDAKWKVQLRMVESSEALLSKCTLLLQSTIRAPPGHGGTQRQKPQAERSADVVSQLCDFLIASAEHDRDEVRVAAEAVLDRVQLASVSDLLQDRLRRRLLALPRVLRGGDSDAGKLATLRQVSGYIKLLGPASASLWTVAFDRLSVALLQSMELDVSDTHVLESKSYYQLRFEYARTDEQRDKLLEIPLLMGSCMASLQLLDQFMDLVRGSLSHLRGPAVVVVNRIVEGMLQRGADVGASPLDPGILRVLQALPEEYIALPSWSLATSPAWSRDAGALRGLEDEQRMRKRRKQAWEHSTGLHGSTYAGYFFSEQAAREGSMNGEGDADNDDDDDSGGSQCRTRQQYQANAQLQGLLIRGLAVFARAHTRPEKFSMRVVFPLLDKLGDPAPLVHRAASVALESIAVTFGFASSSDYIMSNADYLVDAISFRLGALDFSKDESASIAITRILSGLLDQSGAGPLIVPLLGDVMDKIVAALTWNGDSASGVAYLRVLRSIVSAIRAGAASSGDQREPHREREGDDDVVGSADADRCSADQVVRRLAELHATLVDEVKPIDVHAEMDALEAAAQEAGEADDGQDVRDERDTDGQTKASPQQQVVEGILIRCRDFLSSPSVARRVIVLDIVADALGVLAPVQDMLLPAVAQIWDPLKLRFSDGSSEGAKAVLMGVLRVLDVMAMYCGDFLRRRFATELWPSFAALLEMERREMDRFLAVSADPDRIMSTPAFQIQERILRCLHSLMRRSDNMVKGQVPRIAHACQPYLGDAAHPALRAAACDVFRSLTEINGDAVWWSLVQRAGGAVQAGLVPEQAYSADEVMDKLPLRIRALARGVRANSSSDKKKPPLYHPSWTFGSAGSNETARELLLHITNVS